MLINCNTELFCFCEVTFITFRDVKQTISVKYMVVSLLQQAVYWCSGLCLGQTVVAECIINYLSQLHYYGCITE